MAARRTTRPPRAPSGRARPAQPANCRARHRRRAPSAKLAAGTRDRAGQSLQRSKTALRVTRKARSANPPHAASPSRRTEERAQPASRLWTMGRSSEPPAPALPLLPASTPGLRPPHQLQDPVPKARRRLPRQTLTPVCAGCAPRGTGRPHLQELPSPRGPRWEPPWSPASQNLLRVPGVPFSALGSRTLTPFSAERVPSA